VSPACWAASTKIPVPIAAATPNTVRSSAPRLRRSLVPASSVSAMDCSIGLVCHSPLAAITTSFSGCRRYSSAAGRGSAVQVGLQVNDPCGGDRAADPGLGLVDDPGDLGGGHRGRYRDLGSDQ
jgi:hypothetical protein